MQHIKSYQIKNDEWIIVTDNNVTIATSVAKEVGRAIDIIINTCEPAGIECVARTLDASEEMLRVAEYLTLLKNVGVDVDGEFYATLYSNRIRQCPWSVCD